VYNYKYIVVSIFLTISLYGVTTPSEDEFADDGFGDEEIKIEKIDIKKDDKYSIYGSLTTTSNYNYNKNIGISSLKLSSNINQDFKINKNFKIKTTIKAYKDFKTKINNDYDLDVNEIFIQGTLNNKIDLKIGRQVVVWGKSDNIRITDILNPMDYTTPGMTDIKDLRLGRFMNKVNYSTQGWDLTGILLYENRYSTMPTVGSEYYIPKIFPIAPNNSIGLALSASKNYEGQDVAFYASNDYVDNTTFKSNMIGMAYNKVIEQYLLKTEFAYFDNYNSNIINSKIDALVGVEYNGISDGSISLEMANKNNEIQYAMRFTQSYINQTLDFTVLYNGYGKNLKGGGFVRIWADYAINDKFSTSFGMIDYIGGYKQNFEIIKDNDRVFTSLTYNF